MDHGKLVCLQDGHDASVEKGLSCFRPLFAPNGPCIGSFAVLRTHYAGANLNNRFFAITRLTKAQAANT